MDTIEKLIRTTLLSSFSLLNAIDMIQTITFLKLGIEGNLFVVQYPQLWFPIKLAFTLGLPLGLYRLDLYLEAKEDGGIFPYVKDIVALMYLFIFFADVFYLFLVLRSAHLLGGLP